MEAARPRSVLEVVRAALRAGAPAIQLRGKRADAAELLQAGHELLPMAREAGALFVVNDRLDVALALGADGVHLGPDDLPVEAARRAVPRDFLVGASTDDPLRARALVAAGADYIGCGTVYATVSKTDAGSVIGIEGLQRVVEAVKAPVVGIGGIDAARAGLVARATGAAGVAVIGAVMGAADPEAAVRNLLAPWRNRRRSESAKP